MKRKAKQSGSGGRLRLGLLMAAAAAFLLAPAAIASAEDSVILGANEGSGWVKGNEPEDGGNPFVECHWNGALGEWDVGTNEAEGGGVPGLNACETNASVIGGTPGLVLKQEADAGSEFIEWEVLQGAPVSGCTTGTFCSVLFPPIEVKVTFEPEPETYALNLTPEGPGSFECDTGSGAEACQAEYVEGTEVTVIPVPDTGAEFVEFGEDCSGSSCELTMNEPHNVSGQFDLETFAFGTTVEGEGTVQCNVNGGGLAPCPSEATYGDEFEVVATPNSVEFVLEELTGTGSAEGTCSVESGGASGTCVFTVTEASSVTAKFVLGSGIDEAEGNVHGEVPQTTTLEAAGCADVDLGEFIPGEGKEYAETCVATLTSTGAETTFTASDPSGTHTGHLVHSSGAYALESPLEVMAVDAQGLGTGPLTPQPLSPVTMLTFEDPIANDATTLTFEQPIGAEEGLLTGEYAKTILLTLQQTA